MEYFHLVVVAVVVVEVQPHFFVFEHPQQYSNVSYKYVVVEEVKVRRVFLQIDDAEHALLAFAATAASLAVRSTRSTQRVIVRSSHRPSARAAPPIYTKEISTEYITW